MRVLLRVLFVACLFFGASANLGGKSPEAGANDEDLARVEQSLGMINSQSNSLYSLDVVRVISVQKQVVAGVSYTYVVEAMRGDTENPVMEIIVWEKPDGTLEVQSSSVKYVVKSEPSSVLGQTLHLPGGYQKMKTNDPEAKSAAAEAARSLELEPNTIIVICEASAQLVNGINFQLELSRDTCEGETFHAKVFRSFSNEYTVNEVLSDVQHDE
eukprot:CAMPEP_0170144084 /NCGR_PEP_ID=MMETSP0033_2-20121228/13294_1 /TAXON_ID=195969 /ORGANISM="Dolichomastix tenuilepis, Strain CCMP3274" /LENGTH=213 /DNA_ID=CAMNT_0010380565 /DNA_START=28 /DNA_END=669 /DNA_ORIENTATION=-